jgi:MoaA/NifB/PqqE/SkfB family radical SAM enzyme
MLHYKNGEPSDPFMFIFSDPGWLRDYDPPRPFPFWVNIESTNICNLDCLFCSRQLATGPKGHMSDETLARIVKEVAQYPPAAIRVAGWGEPLLHPRFLEHVRLIKTADIPLKVYTNGIKLTEDLMAGFIEAGLDELQFSMQGLTPEQYEFNRRKSDFNVFRQNVEMAARVRDRCRSTKPFLSILTSVLKSELTSASPSQFIEDWSPYVDKIAVDLTNLNFVKHLDRVKDLLADQALCQVHKPCVDVFLAIEVNYNGVIEFCGQDANQTPEHILGHVQDCSIHEAWHSPKMEAHRQLVGRDNRHDQMAICRNCYHNTDKYELFKQKY